MIILPRIVLRFHLTENTQETPSNGFFLTIMNPHRRSSKMTGLNVQALRRSRASTQIQLRKTKKNDSLSKRRRSVDFSQAAVSADTDIDLPKLIANLKSSSPTLQSVKQVRQFVCSSDSPPPPEITNQDVIHAIAKLTRHSNTDLLHEALWLLTNVSAADHTDVVVESGVVPTLIGLQEHYDPKIRHQAMWTLGNIAGDNTSYRDDLIEANILQGVALNVYNPENDAILKEGAWEIHNLVRGQQTSTWFGMLTPLLPILSHLLSSEDGGVIEEICWTIVDASDSKKQLLKDKLINLFQSAGGLIGRLHDLLSTSDSLSILLPTLKIFGNFCSGSSPIFTQRCLDLNITAVLPKFLNHASKRMRREAAYLVSNIAAGEKAQVRSLLWCNDGAKIVRTIVNIAKDDVFPVRKEAVFALCNICSDNDRREVEFCIENDCVRAMVGSLESNDVGLTVAILTSLDNILKLNSGKY